jgi:raffinose/stachyose/melibiose transport system substrate-binding protein
LRKRFWSLLLVMVMVVSLFAGCKANEKASDKPVSDTSGKETSDTDKAKDNDDKGSSSDEKVNITFYSTQVGMDDKFEDIIDKFEEANPNITVEYIAAGDNQLQKWMSLYASNEGPTVSLMDPINIWENMDRMLVLDPSENPWMDQVYESAYASYIFNGDIYAIPISTQGYGILYNQRVLDNAVGGKFDPDSIRTRDDLKELFDKIEATGVAATMITGVNWSIGMHYLALTYAGYRENREIEKTVVEQSKAGTFDLANDEIFNSFMDTFDMLAEYNYNKADPLVGNIDMDAEALATGKVGTWFMGDWSWVQLKDIPNRDTEFGILPIPINNDPNDDRNRRIPASQPKGYCIDISQNSVEKQEAGKKFIEFICFDNYAQQVISDVMGATLPYKNVTVKSDSPLAAATAWYSEQGRTIDISNFILMPSDFWYENGAYMEAYLSGAIDRATLASQVNDYWKNH